MLLLKNTGVDMAFIRLNVTFIFAGFLISFVLVNSESVVDKAASSLTSIKTLYQAANIPSNFAEEVLETHNEYRKKHGVPALTLDKQLSQTSQEWANAIARSDRLKHRPSHEWGENIYVSWNSNPNFQIQPNASVISWYSEVKDYDYSNNPNILATGHFTQVVWKSSKYLGVGVAKSNTNKVYVVCNYFPPGNVMGLFSQNVPRPI